MEPDETRVCKCHGFPWLIDKCPASEHITATEIHEKYYGSNQRPRYFDSGNDAGIDSFEAMVLAQLSRITGSVGQPAAKRTVHYSDTEMKILHLLMDCKSRSEAEIAAAVNESQVGPSMHTLECQWVIEHPVAPMSEWATSMRTWRISLEGINVYAAMMRKRRADIEHEERVKCGCVIPKEPPTKKQKR